MFKEERQQKIIDILNELNFASVNKLSKMLYVSLPTIRRDLTFLEKSGMIIRNHGGAMRLNKGTYEIPLEFRNNYKIHEKQNMCKKAAKLISDGDIIFIDASTSTMNIANYIDKKNVTVVTNGMPIAMMLAKRKIKTHCVGGEVMATSLGFGGKFAEMYVAEFNYNLAFFSAYGVNKKGMVVDVSLAETRLRKEVFKNCDKKVFLFDKTKENMDAPYNVIKIKDVEVVISE